MPLEDYQSDFLHVCIDRGALRFGDFQLKSGRRSPFFFNAGVLCDGDVVRLLGQWYARVLKEQLLGVGKGDDGDGRRVDCACGLWIVQSLPLLPPLISALYARRRRVFLLYLNDDDAFSDCI